MKCLHCKRRTRANGKRGLCYACYFAPGVRERYPKLALSTNRRGVEDRAGATPDPKPTQAAPGTKHKVMVLAARAARGESLFHRADCDTLDGVTAAEMAFDADGRAKQGPKNGPRLKKNRKRKPKAA